MQVYYYAWVQIKNSFYFSCTGGCSIPIFCVLGSILKKQKIAIISNLVRGNNLNNLLFCNSTKVYIILTL